MLKEVDHSISRTIISRSRTTIFSPHGRNAKLNDQNLKRWFPSLKIHPARPFALLRDGFLACQGEQRLAFARFPWSCHRYSLSFVQDSDDILPRPASDVPAGKSCECALGEIFDVQILSREGLPIGKYAWQAKSVEHGPWY